MGAWSSSIFGNDEAADFSYEFDDATSVEAVVPILEQAMDRILNARGIIDSSDGAVGLAAAALVVAWAEPDLLGSDAAYAPDPWPRVKDSLPRHLDVKAAAVLDSMSRTDLNELAELWAEAGQLSEFQTEISRWRSKL
ncbi:DUF4259 domain-containing protein [Paenarthrobacter sp. NPDC056912]|uniref:DUF4259 domain-containing protein n=1 Tax=Paenarthrobacter sp. NPDC056912 TaxID=3345965 RepID=UPI003670395C